jgi:hypothetical protein
MLCLLDVSCGWCLLCIASYNKVLDVVIEVFNNGGSQRLDIPEPPSSCPVPSAATPEMTKAERFQIFRQRMALRRRKAEMYSLWCDALYRLSLANHVSGKFCRLQNLLWIIADLSIVRSNVSCAHLFFFGKCSEYLRKLTYYLLRQNFLYTMH